MLYLIELSRNVVEVTKNLFEQKVKAQWTTI